MTLYNKLTVEQADAKNTNKYGSFIFILNTPCANSKHFRRLVILISVRPLRTKVFNSSMVIILKSAQTARGTSI